MCGQGLVVGMVSVFSMLRAELSNFCQSFPAAN